MTPQSRKKRVAETRTVDTFRDYVHKTLEEQNRTLQHLTEKANRTSLTLHGESGQNGLAAAVRELMRRDAGWKWFERTVFTAFIGACVLALVAGLRYLVIATK